MNYVHPNLIPTPAGQAIYSARPATIRPKIPAPARVARISGAAFPVEVAEAAASDAEELADEPVSCAPLELAEVELPDTGISTSTTTPSLQVYSPIVAVVEAEDAPLVATAPAAVLLRKFELTQLA